MLLKITINSNLPTLASFLFSDNKLLIIQQHRPCKSKQVTYTQSEETTTAN